ncbi:7087_t:CDS:1 [Ambispora gerdemannii]|uniref:7087_t:CDS:1 n=1 Tax=Ambispora gerdemannii TaxID=144530 RepID=A0A9N9F0R6_9GLOM|nr:7087_t:CDS:1 [Ambispora gerdemannii]
MATDELLAKVILKLQDPVPQYVLGCLPAIATIGAAPKKSFISKLFWVFRCLGCPFIGLFYTCNVKIDETTLYWLNKSCFKKVYEGNVEGQIVAEEEIPHRPFGHHAMMVIHKNSTHSNPIVLERLNECAASNDTVLKRLDECVADASVLERLSSSFSAYYIFVGILAGITRVIGPRTCEDWPYIPLTLSWTLPAIYRRTVRGKLVVKDPERLKNTVIYVESFAKGNEEHHTRVVLTALASIIVPWISILLAYFTPPIGYFCRSKYLTVICSVWSFNNILAYIHHWLEDKYELLDTIIRVWFNLCGVFVVVAFFLLALLANENKWWVDLFGPSCDVSDTCSIKY